MNGFNIQKDQVDLGDYGIRTSGQCSIALDIDGNNQAIHCQILGTDFRDNKHVSYSISIGVCESIRLKLVSSTRLKNIQEEYLTENMTDEVRRITDSSALNMKGKLTLKINSTPLHFDYSGKIKISVCLTRRSDIVSCYCDIGYYPDDNFNNKLSIRRNVTLSDEIFLHFFSESDYRSEIGKLWEINAIPTA